MELRFGGTRHTFSYTLFLLHDKEEGIAAALLAKNLLEAMNAKTIDSVERTKLTELME